MFESIFVNQQKPSPQAQEAPQPPTGLSRDNSISTRCCEHVHFALEFDGLDFCDFLVREPSTTSRRPSSGSPIVSSH